MNYYRTQCSFGQAETFIGSDHRDLFARRLGDDLRVLVLWGDGLCEKLIRSDLSPGFAFAFACLSHPPEM
jgi:hypothetical protein